MNVLGIAASIYTAAEEGQLLLERWKVCVFFFYLNIARAAQRIAVGSMLMNYLSVYRI